MRDKKAILHRRFEKLFSINLIVIIAFCTDIRASLAISPLLTDRESINESFSTEASDLVRGSHNERLDVERQVELMKLLRKLSETYVEVGEYSCYVSIGVGNENSSVSAYSSIFYNIPPSTFTLTTFTPVRGRQTVTLKSEDTDLLEIKKSCYTSLNLARQIELLWTVQMYNPKQNLELELNIENSWNLLPLKD